jgi:transcriptional regulator GlxA family with amidase domain
MPNSRPRQIGFLLVPGFSLLSYASTIEPLRAANRLSGRNLYKWSHISTGGDTSTASSGLAVAADHKVGEDVDLDTIFVCAGGNPALFRQRPTLAWLRELSRRGVAIGGVSGGPYILARAGLLEGYRCTIHWEHMAAFREEFPDLNAHRTLYEIDRDRLTCAGGIAALDMMRAIIGSEHGPALATAVSGWFLQTHLRLGSGPQRLTLRERYGVSSRNLLKALEAMEGSTDKPLSRRKLAERAGVSIRQLERLFASHLKTTIGTQYMRIRLDRARALIHETTMPMLAVAIACGFTSASHFSRAYKTQFGRTPKDERKAGEA